MKWPGVPQNLHPVGGGAGNPANPDIPELGAGWMNVLAGAKTLTGGLTNRLGALGGTPVFSWFCVSIVIMLVSPLMASVIAI